MEWRSIEVATAVHAVRKDQDRRQRTGHGHCAGGPIAMVAHSRARTAANRREAFLLRGVRDASTVRCEPTNPERLSPNEDAGGIEGRLDPRLELWERHVDRRDRHSAARCLRDPA